MRFACYNNCHNCLFWLLIWQKKPIAVNEQKHSWEKKDVDMHLLKILQTQLHPLHLLCLCCLCIHLATVAVYYPAVWTESRARAEREQRERELLWSHTGCTVILQPWVDEFPRRGPLFLLWLDKLLCLHTVSDDGRPGVTICERVIVSVFACECVSFYSIVKLSRREEIERPSVFTETTTATTNWKSCGSGIQEALFLGFHMLSHFSRLSCIPDMWQRSAHQRKNLDISLNNYALLLFKCEMIGH